MNDFSDLEHELKQLRPAAPSAELISRVERALGEAPATTATAGVLPRRKVSVNWFALGFGLAAAAAFLILARVNVERTKTGKPPRLTDSKPAAATLEQPPLETPRTLLPDGVTRVVYNTRDEGLVYPANADRPVRRVRSISRETLQWKDPHSGASLCVSYPTEDIQLIPVSGQ